jgi:hypothetical protein
MSNSILGDSANAITIVGLLVEKLGGSVVLTEDEVNQSLVSRSKSLYVEVHDRKLVLEVIPDKRFPQP